MQVCSRDQTHELLDMICLYELPPLMSWRKKKGATIVTEMNPDSSDL